MLPAQPQFLPCSVGLKHQAMHTSCDASLFPPALGQDAPSPATKLLYVSLAYNGCKCSSWARLISVLSWLLGEQCNDMM